MVREIVYIPDWALAIDLFHGKPIEPARLKAGIITCTILKNIRIIRI